MDEMDRPSGAGSEGRADALRRTETIRALQVRAQEMADRVRADRAARNQRAAPRSDDVEGEVVPFAPPR
jgi:hypothetical protein